MKALAAVIALLLAAGGVWVVVRDSSEDPEVVEQSRAGQGRRGRSRRAEGPGAGRGERRGAAADASLERRVAALEKEVALLRRQAKFRGRVPITSGGDRPKSVAEDPALENEIRAIYEQEREREREERDTSRQQHWAERREASLDELVVLSKISTEQRESIGALWSTEADRMGPLIAEMRSGDRGYKEIREEARGIREETDEAVKAMLSESQYETYLELRPRGPGGGRPRP